MSDATQQPSAFDKMKAESTTIQARFDAGTETIIAHASSMGVTLAPEDVADMAVLHIYALGGEALAGNEQYDRELNSIPAIAAAKRREAMAESVRKGEGAAHDELMLMQPADRMTWSRQHLGTDTSMTQERVTADTEADRLEILLSMPPAARIAQARAWGMTGQE